MSEPLSHEFLVELREVLARVVPHINRVADALDADLNRRRPTEDDR